MSNQYLYGASIQGIQEYIFRTNKLSDVVSKSEIVNNICTKAFFSIFGEGKSDRLEPIVMAAGNVKCILNETDCRSPIS